MILELRRTWTEITRKYLVEENIADLLNFPLNPEESLRIVVILTDRIGDAFNSIYFLHNLRMNFPNSKIIYIGKEFEDLTFLNNVLTYYVDEVLDAERLEETQFRELMPDIIFDLNPIMALFPYTIPDVLRVGHHAECGIHIPQYPHNYKANDHLNILRAFGFKIDLTYPDLPIPHGKDNRFQKKINHPFIALCLEATARCWMMTPIVMSGLVDWLLQKFNYDIYIIGSNINEHGYEFKGGADRVKNLTGKDSIVQSLYLLNNAEFVISVDTGMMHAAAYLGQQVLAIFTSGNPAKNGPQGKNGNYVVINVRTDPPCLVWEKRDYKHCGDCQRQLNLHHVVEGLQLLLASEKTLLSDYIVDSRLVSLK